MRCTLEVPTSKVSVLRLVGEDGNASSLGRKAGGSKSPCLNAPKLSLTLHLRLLAEESPLPWLPARLQSLRKVHAWKAWASSRGLARQRRKKGPKQAYTGLLGRVGREDKSVRFCFGTRRIPRSCLHRLEKRQVRLPGGRQTLDTTGLKDLPLCCSRRNLSVAATWPFQSK